MSTVRLIRHATVLVGIGGTTFLVDPMLDDAEAHEAVEGTMNPVRWPLVGLPAGAMEAMRVADAALITHTHVDHLDESAIVLLRSREMPVFCQPFDVDELLRRGLADVRPVDDTAHLGGIVVRRTGGQHGFGEQADLMGPVSGWVLEAAGDSVYVAGDTVWCEEVSDVLERHGPRTVVVNAGEARMVVGDRITMSAADVLATATFPGRRVVVAVHMEALNHCLLTRAELGAAAEAEGIRVLVPADGESLHLGVDLGAT